MPASSPASMVNHPFADSGIPIRFCLFRIGSKVVKLPDQVSARNIKEGVMSRKLIAAGVAAVMLAGSVVATTSSAQAGGYWGYHHYHHGPYWGSYAAAGALGALAVGAVAASAYDSCYYESRPIFNRWGDVIAYRRVPVC